MQKVIERVLNLLAYLLTSQRPVTAEEIRMTVAGYDQNSDEAWRRMFERDKDLVRRLGIPIELEPTDGWGIEHGYVVPAGEYALPDPGLTDEEQAALSIAAKVVRIGGRTSGTEALFKLGGARVASAGEPLAADLGREERELVELFVAVTERRRVRFEYSGKGRAVDPYGLVHRRGHWYVIGREAERVKVFRVDRVSDVVVGDTPDAFDRPAGFRAADAIAEAPWEAGPEDTEAEVSFDASVAWWARRQLVGSTEIEDRADGSLRARLRVANPDAFVGWMLSFDDAAEILAPDELRTRLVERVRAAR
jgi:predicted DNA-binding transcriptional regulator YafY